MREGIDLLKSYNNGDLNTLEYILYNIILGIVYWIITSFIVSIQQYLLYKFKLSILGLLLYMCPFIIFYWFIQVTSQKIKLNKLAGYSKFVAFLIFMFTLTVFICYFGFLKFKL